MEQFTVENYNQLHQHILSMQEEVELIQNLGQGNNEYQEFSDEVVKNYTLGVLLDGIIEECVNSPEQFEQLGAAFVQEFMDKNNLEVEVEEDNE